MRPVARSRTENTTITKRTAQDTLITRMFVFCRTVLCDLIPTSWRMLREVVIEAVFLVRATVFRVRET